jgi:hypothetical protein
MARHPGEKRSAVPAGEIDSEPLLSEAQNIDHERRILSGVVGVGGPGLADQHQEVSVNDGVSEFTVVPCRFWAPSNVPRTWPMATGSSENDASGTAVSGTVARPEHEL